MQKLTPQEEEAMLHIWEIAPCFIRDILARYEEPKLPYTTLASIIKNLERKKYIKGKRHGNTYQYNPLIGEQEYKKTFMNGIIQNYYENSYKKMVTFFAKEEKISTDDLKEIIRIIEKGKES